MAAVPSPTAAPDRHAPAPSARDRPDLRLVGAPQRHGRWIAALVVTCAIGVLGVVALHALAAEASFEARELEAEVAELSSAREELAAEVAAMESPDRIREVAVEELGMVPAERPGYVVLEDTDRHLAQEDTELAAAQEREGASLAERIVRLLTTGG